MLSEVLAAAPASDEVRLVPVAVRIRERFTNDGCINDVHVFPVGLIVLPHHNDVAASGEDHLWSTMIHDPKEHCAGPAMSIGMKR